jgi:hypothetical protein
LIFPLGSAVLTVIAFAAVGLWVAMVIVAWERVATSTHAVRKRASGDHEPNRASPPPLAAWLPSQRNASSEAPVEPSCLTHTP